MDQFSHNSVGAGIRHAVFIPDQLISGPLQIVTDTVRLAKAGLLSRGTVLGQIAASGEYVICKKGATDGSQVPCAILVDTVSSLEDSVLAGVYLMGEFNQHRLIIDESWSLDALKYAMRPFSIFLRDSVQA